MGCCESIAVAPDIILDDPDINSNGETMLIHSLSMFNSDFTVYKGEEEKLENSWMFLNCVDGKRYDLENFKRKEGESKGEVLYSAVFENSFSSSNLQEQQRHFGNTDDVVENTKQFFNSMFTVPNQNQNPYPSDLDLIIKYKSNKSFNDNMCELFISNWQYNTNCQIIPGTRINGITGNQTLQLNVAANGSAVACFEWIKQTSEEDRPSHWKKDVEEYVNVIDYKLSTYSGQDLAYWRVIGDNEICALEVPGLFTTTKAGGWGRTDSITKTSSGIDPCLAVLLSHLCLEQYGVNEIKKLVVPNFKQPHKPKY